MCEKAAAVSGGRASGRSVARWPCRTERILTCHSNFSDSNRSAVLGRLQGHNRDTYVRLERNRKRNKAPSICCSDTIKKASLLWLLTISPREDHCASAQDRTISIHPKEGGNPRYSEFNRRSPELSNIPNLPSTPRNRNPSNQPSYRPLLLGA